MFPENRKEPMRQAVGFLGGTFNPVHNGHLLLAEEARVQFHLDEVLFVPNHLPPHRSPNAEELIDGETRYIMTILATLSHPRFRVSPIELSRQGPSYTYDTMVELKKGQPENQYYFIGGADCLIHHTWHRFEELSELLDGFLLASRSPDRFDAALQKVRLVSPAATRKFSEIKMAPVEIAATDIRRRIQAGQSIRYLVPESVGQFIERYRLYSEVYQH